MRKKRRFWRRMAALLAAVTLLRGRYGLCVTRYTLSSPGLPESFDGFRIVQVSDLHGDFFGRDNARLARRIAAEKPDLIAVTGDAASDERELASFRALLEKLGGLAPVFYVTGNHEWAGGIVSAAVDMAEAAGAEALQNEARELYRGGESILIAGVDDPNGRADMVKPDELTTQLRDKYGEKYLVLLGHRNDWPETYPTLPADLILCGHAHGGVVRLPFLGGLINTDRSIPARYDSGVYETKTYVMVVSRGLGSTGWVPRVFNCPEVVTVILRSETAS